MQKNSDSVIIKSTKNVCLDTLETIGVTKFKKNIILVRLYSLF